MNDLFLNVILLSAVIPLASFIFFYARFSPWTSTIEGKTIMFQKIGFLSYILFVLAVKFFGDFPGVDFVRFIIYGFIVTMFWTMFVNLIKAQRSSKVYNRSKKTSQKD